MTIRAASRWPSPYNIQGNAEDLKKTEKKPRGSCVTRVRQTGTAVELF